MALGLVLFPALRAPATASPASPLGSPTAPLEEEEEKRGEAKSAAESATADRRTRRDSPPTTATGHLTRPTITAASSVLSRAAPLDPFRNGLGSPFRC